MNKNPYKKKEARGVYFEDWKCFDCVWKNKEVNSKIAEGFCRKNEKINEKGCPLFVKVKKLIMK